MNDRPVDPRQGAIDSNERFWKGQNGTLFRCHTDSQGRCPGMVGGHPCTYDADGHEVGPRDHRPIG